MDYGLSEHQVKEIIQHELDNNPDLKYYINNQYFDEFVSLLLDGISKAIVASSNKVITNLERDIKRHSSVWK